ncbi:hypothetical protein HYT05_01230 [Candidatus Kaiserbacteria bacterium]|nr:hypothetical protein [Candidatus Kaiserbacteria bacterium]
MQPWKSCHFEGFSLHKDKMALETFHQEHIQAQKPRESECTKPRGYGAQKNYAPEQYAFRSGSPYEVLVEASLYKEVVASRNGIWQTNKSW